MKKVEVLFVVRPDEKANYTFEVKLQVRSTSNNCGEQPSLRLVRLEIGWCHVVCS